MKKAPKKGAGTKAEKPKSARGGTPPTKRGSTPRPPPPTKTTKAKAPPTTRAAPPRGWVAAAEARRNTERLAAAAERAAAAARSERAQRAADTRRQNAAAAAERAAAAARSERAQRAADTRRRNAAAAAERAAAAARSERAQRAAETRRRNAAAERAAAEARSERARRAAATRRQNAIDLAEIRRLSALAKEERRAEGRTKAAETRARKKAEKAAAEAAKAAAEAAEAAAKAPAAQLPPPHEYELGQGKFRRQIVVYRWEEAQLPRTQLVIEVGGNVLELQVCNPGPELQAWIRERLDLIIAEHADDPAALFWIRIHSVDREITEEGDVLNEEEHSLIQTTGLGIAPGDERDVRNQAPEWAGRVAEKQRAKSPSRKRGGGAPEETEETEQETEVITVIDWVQIQIQRTVRMVGVTP